MAGEAGKGDLAKDLTKKRRESKSEYYKIRKEQEDGCGYKKIKRVWMVTIADYKDAEGNWVKCKTIGAIQFRTKSYELWKGMMYRCNGNSLKHKRTSVYIGCKASSEFQDFQKFTDWHVRQIGYLINGYAIDKDILGGKVKIYSSETCALIPSQLNAFFTVKKERALPAGVKFNSKSGKFKVEMKIANKPVYIGSFMSVDDARLAYEKAKSNEAKRWADRLRLGEYLVDKRVIAALDKWGNNV